MNFLTDNVGIIFICMLLSAIAIWLYNSIHFLPDEKVKIITKWVPEGETIRVLTASDPPWICWPKERIRETVKIERITYDIDEFNFLCTYTPSGINQRETQIELTSGEISVVYEKSFFNYDAKGERTENLGKVSTYFKETAKHLEEMIKDICQSIITEEMAEMDLEKARTYTDPDRKVLKRMREEADSRNLPILITAFEVNSPPTITDKATSDMFESIAQAGMNIQAQEAEIEVAKAKAKGEKEAMIIIAEGEKLAKEITAEGEKNAMGTIAIAYQLDKLSVDKANQFWIELKTTEAYMEMAKSDSKTFVLGNLTSTIGDVMKKIIGG